MELALLTSVLIATDSLTSPRYATHRASVFCFPEGVPARRIRVNASASDLNDALYGFGARTRSADQSSVSGSAAASASAPSAVPSAEEFIFSIKVARPKRNSDNHDRPLTPKSQFEKEYMVLYGICLRTNDLVEVEDVPWESDVEGIELHTDSKRGMGRRKRQSKDGSSDSSDWDSKSDDDMESAASPVAKPKATNTSSARGVTSPFEYLRSLGRQLELDDTARRKASKGKGAVDGGGDKQSATKEKSKSFYLVGKCYCLLSSHPLFPVHFDVLRTILRQERLYRM